VSFSGTTPEKQFPTANGNGLAMLDYDQDGWQDLYFASGCRLDQDTPAPPNALYRSRFAEEFEKATEHSGTGITGYTQGIASADYDNDGFPDLHLIRYGADILLENNGDGTFRDVTGRSGLGDTRWGTSAAFLDFDEDGALDLYVAHYGQWDLTWHHSHFCGRDAPRLRTYCSPKLVTPEPHGLYRCSGDGRFEDVASLLGIARSDGRGQGVVAADLNNDGHIDIYVANDLTPNFLFINGGSGRMEDFSEASCAAYSADGLAQAGMGVDAGDVDGDGLLDLFVTNFIMEYNALYRNLGYGNLFQDVSNWNGITAGGMQAVGWGTALEDLDGDGWLDALAVNGHVDDNAMEQGRNEPYAQKPALWYNRGKGKFQKVDDVGPYFSTSHVSRGASFGDLDNDGDVDVVITHKDDRPTILRNDSRTYHKSANAWVQLKLVGILANRDAVGARVEVDCGGRRLTRQIRGGSSYLSAHDQRLEIGLGTSAKVDRITIHWPSGVVTEMADLATNQSYTIREPSLQSSQLREGGGALAEGEPVAAP
jgi:hypothetical protein